MKYPDYNPLQTPLTDDARKKIQATYRGRLIRSGVYRNFCCVCGIPMEIKCEWMRTDTTLKCDDCRPEIMPELGYVSPRIEIPYKQARPSK